MDTNLILSFIEDNTSEERNNLIIKALSLIEDMSDDIIYSDIENIVLTDTLTTTDVKLDTINNYITESLVTILDQHFIYLTDTAVLSELNALVEGIILLQNLEDYYSPQAIVYGSDDPIEVLCELTSSLTGVDKFKLFPSIDSVGDKFLDTYRTFIDEKITEEPKTLRDVSTIKNFISLYGTKNISFILLKSGIPLGEPLDFYIPFIDESVEDTLEEIAINILGLILLSTTELDSILDIYNDNSDTLIGNLDVITKVEALLTEMILQLKNKAHE